MTKPNSSPPTNSRRKTTTAPAGSAGLDGHLRRIGRDAADQDAHEQAEGGDGDGIVQQRLALGQDGQPLGRADIAEDADDRRRVGGRHHGAQQQADDDVHAGRQMDDAAHAWRCTPAPPRWPAAARPQTSSSRRRTSIVRPAVKSSGGRNSGRNTSVPTSSLSRPTKASPSAPSLMSLEMIHEPRKPSPMPAMASRTVCGRRKRSASGTSTLTTVSTMAIASRA